MLHAFEESTTPVPNSLVRSSPHIPVPIVADQREQPEDVPHIMSI